VTPLYPQKLALTSPTGGGRSLGIVRVRTKATEFFFLYRSLQVFLFSYNYPKFLAKIKALSFFTLKTIMLTYEKKYVSHMFLVN